MAEWVEGYLISESGELYSDGLEDECKELFDVIKTIIADCNIVNHNHPHCGKIAEIEVSAESFRYACKDSACIHSVHLSVTEHRQLYDIVYSLVEAMDLDNTLPYRDLISVGEDYICLTYIEN